MRITFNVGTSRVLTSFGDSNRPPWLGGTYHPMGNGYELRVEPLSGGSRVMVFTRRVGASKTKSLVVPIVGYRMPVDVGLDETGKPNWDMSDVITRLLGEFKFSPRHVHVQIEGRWLALVSWRERELKYSEGSRYHSETRIFSQFGEGPVDAVEGAVWAIETYRGDEGQTVRNVYVWSDLAKRPDEQKNLWTALREVMAE